MGFFNALTNLFGGGNQQGYQDASNSIGQGINAMQNSYSAGRDQITPYASAGTTALPQYQNLLSTMSNPVDFYTGVMNQYQASPDYNFQMQQMQKAMDQSAAAGGTLGSPSQQQALAQYTQGLTTQDMQQFFGNVMGVQGQYQSGLGNLINTGQNAANTLNSNYMQQGNNQGMLYNAQGNAALGSAQGQANGFQNLLGTALNGASSIMGSTFGNNKGSGGGISNPSAYSPAMSQFSQSLF